jgi:hypothetical protein
VAIFLEKRHSRFHYSVIDLDARINLAPEIADCHVLNAELSASSSRGDNVVARAQAGDGLCFDQTGPDFGFEPAQERLMRMGTFSLAIWTSTSRSPRSE